MIICGGSFRTLRGRIYQIELEILLMHEVGADDKTDNLWENVDTRELTFETGIYGDGLVRESSYFEFVCHRQVKIRIKERWSSHMKGMTLSFVFIMKRRRPCVS